MNTQGRGKVIVLGCTHGGLAAIRSLGRSRLHVIAISYVPTEFGLGSRYIAEKAFCPHPEDKRAFADFLLNGPRSWDGALILETNDYFAAALAEHKDELSQKYRLITPDCDVTHTFLEKDKTYALADECDVPHPNIYEPQSMDDLNAIAGQLKFPVMIKPVLSHEFVRIFGKKLIITEILGELQAKFQQILDAKQPVILSEIIPGTDYKTIEKLHVYVNSKGDICAEFFNVKLRQTPPMYGVVRVGKSVAPIKDVREYSHRLLKQSNYRGYANLEFKRDPRDNIPKLMEVNIRMPRGLALPVASGVDFPWLIYQDIVLDQQVTVMDYDHNTYLIEIVADVADFLRYDQDRNLRRFVQPYLARRKAFSEFSWSDPGPLFRQLRMRGLRFIRKTSSMKKQSFE